MTNSGNKSRVYFSSSETIKIIDELLENEVFQKHLQGYIAKNFKLESKRILKLKRNEIKKFARKIGIPSNRSKSLTIKLKNIANLCTKRKKSKKLFESAWELIMLKKEIGSCDYESRSDLLKQIEKRKGQIFEMVYFSKRKAKKEDCSSILSDEEKVQLIKSKIIKNNKKRSLSDNKSDNSLSNCHPMRRFWPAFGRSRSYNNWNSNGV